MYRFFPFALLLTACSQQPGAPSLRGGTFEGAGRDRLCIEGEPGNYRAGLIVYGSDDRNCSASGRLAVEADKVALVPKGEGDCSIPLSVDGDLVRIGDVPEACSYYCGPGVQLRGKSFRRSEDAGYAVDLAGTALC